MELTRSYKFSASHQMVDSAMTESENIERYGHCSRDHGHSFQLDVTVTGEPSPASGMILNAEELDVRVKNNLIGRWDHRHLNHEVEEFLGKVVSAEQILLVAWDMLSKSLDGFNLSRLRLVQSPNTFFEYRGEKR